MAKIPNKHYHYDPRRPASTGQWVVTTRGKNMVLLETKFTEYEARKAVGLRGGSKERRYVPCPK